MLAAGERVHHPGAEPRRQSRGAADEELQEVLVGAHRPPQAEPPTALGEEHQVLVALGQLAARRRLAEREQDVGALVEVLDVQRLPGQAHHAVSLGDREREAALAHARGQGGVAAR